MTAPTNDVVFPTPPTITKLITGGTAPRPIVVYTGTDSTGQVWTFDVDTRWARRGQIT